MVQRGGVLDSTSVVDAGLQKMGLQVLGVQRADGSYEGAPSADSILKPGDLVFLYGRNREVSEFCLRGPMRERSFPAFSGLF
jgi:Trk K+ transport system NAD-binding subunit